MITPTVGRVVWFGGAETDHLTKLAEGEPLAAIVTKVHSDTSVDVVIFPPGSPVHGAHKVRLLQDDEQPPTDTPFCMWMPYQKGQAAKHEKGGGSFEELKKRVEALEEAVTAKGSLEELANRVKVLEQLAPPGPPLPL